MLSRIFHQKRSRILLSCLLTGVLSGSSLFSQNPLKIVPVGNSITQGNTYSYGPYTFRRNLWYKLINAGYNVDFVGSLDTDRYGDPFPDPGYDHDHEGHWGWRADEIIAELPGWLTGYTPDVALIHIGTNDVIQENPVESTLDEIEDIIGILRSDNPGITIFLAQILPLADADRNARVNGINAGLVSLASSLDQAQSPIILVDQNSGWVPGSHTYDGVHPNTAGEERMAQRWFEAFDAYYSAPNESPVITGQYSLSTEEDQPLTLSVSDFIIDDPDTDPGDMTLIISDASHYSVSGTTITPEENWSGTLTVPVKVSDGVSESNTYSALITVDPVNDSPEISGQSTLELDEGGSLGLILSHFTFSDVDDPEGPFSLTVLPGSNYTHDGNTITPANQFYGTLTVPVTIGDGSDDSDPFHAQVSVTEVNDPPKITGQIDIISDEDQSVTLQISDFIIADPDTEPRSMTLIVSAGSHYSISGTALTPEADWYGTLTVPVKVSDGVSESNTFYATVTVDPVNDGPEVLQIPGQTIAHGEIFDSIHLDEYADDPETPDEDLVWTASGNMNLEIEISSGIARISVVDENWYGTEIIVFIATDDDAVNPLWDSCQVAFIVETPVSVPDKDLLKVKAWLDPLTEILSIVTSRPERLSVSVLSSNGQSLITGEFMGADHSIDLSACPDGVYFIILRAEDFIETRKVLK